MKRESGATRMISSACINEQYFGGLTQGPNDGLQRGPLTQREQSRHIGTARAFGNDRVFRYATTVHPHGSAPRGFSGFAGSRIAAPETDETRTDL
jgi:hypothetical protein